MKVDKTYCASSYLMYRTVADTEKCFSENLKINRANINVQKDKVKTSEDLYSSLERQMKELTADGKAALALSGGIDSAILAKFMPKGSTCYTFQCIVPGTEVANEVPQAAKYAEECGLKQVVVPIYWEDFEKYAPILMKHKGAPIHSIEVQIYKASLKAKEDGFERLIFGETADANYGGHSNILSKDWTVGEFIDRYSYVKPYHVLKNFEMPISPVAVFANEGGYADVHECFRNFFLKESIESYINACECANIEVSAPYFYTWLDEPLDYERIRKGENKYIVREVFNRLYKDFEVPAKLPMPRATNEWLKDWKGPKREEFWPNCTINMTGDQKWLVYCLEMFLDMIDSDL